MKTLRNLLLSATLPLAASFAQAQIPGTQIPPRQDDQFQRNLIVSRIDFNEKMNSSMVQTFDGSIYGKMPYENTGGVVAALISGLREGKYLAQSPDDLNKSLTWDEVNKIATQICSDNSLAPEEDPDLIDLEEFPIVDELDSQEEIDVLPSSNSSAVEGFSITPFETVMEIIEDRIFDKNRSDIVHNIQYIRIVWVDPSEAIPDKNFICLKYSDVLDVLEKTAWVNKYNDAETRNLREVFELRMFNSFVTNVSGRGVRTLEESQFRNDQVNAFEHHLWSY